MSDSESETSTAVAEVRPTRPSRPLSVFSDEASFTSAQRICTALTSSTMVPESYRGKENTGNALIALDMSNRMGIPALMVMQNLDVIEGKPSWKSQFIIGALNSCGLFSPLRFRVTDLGEREAAHDRWSGPKGDRRKETVKAKISDKEFIAYAVEKATGEVLEGPPVTLSMAVAEGWYFRPGSKWQTMPDLMGRYRAAAFFGRLYAPHILNGMPMEDEVLDIAALRDVTPAAEPEADTSEKKPAPTTRPKGVQAAMKNAAAKKDKGTQAAAPSEPERNREAEDAQIIEEAEREGPASDDVFDADDDSDYEPA